MPNNKITQNIPKLRFPGFSGEWMNGLLRDFFDNMGGTTLEKFVDKNSKYKFISIGNYSKDGKYIDNGQRVKLNEKTKTKLLEKNNLVMVLNDKTSAGDIIGSSILIDKDDEYIYNQRSERIICRNNIFPVFAWHFLNSRKFRKNIFSISQGGTQIYVNFPSIKKIKISVPSKPEQQKIADFLSAVDSWIENLKNQKKSLQEYKKGFMQKIFSQEIRFKDDNGKDFPKWEEKRLGEVGIVRTSSVDKKTNSDEKKVRLLNYMDVYKRDHIFPQDSLQEVTAKDSQILSCNLKKGDVMFTPSSETPTDIGHSAVIMEDLPNTVFSYHIVRLRPKKDLFIPGFSAYAFKSFSFYKELWRRAQGATRFTLSLNTFNEVSIIFPKSLDEQEKIADFLSSIDNLIESKQQQITEAEQWKKGLMQGLFV